MRFRDLPTPARVFIHFVVVSGVCLVAYSLWRVVTDTIPAEATLLAALTLLTGSATVRIPGIPATATVSETFTFTSVLLFGPEVGALIVTLDALAIAFWLTRKGEPAYRSVFSVTAVPLAIWAGAQLFFQLANISPLYFEQRLVEPIQLAGYLFVFATVYFCLNSLFVAIAIGLESRRSFLTLWRINFAWLSVHYLGGASLALLLATYFRNLDFGSIALVTPILVVLYLAFATAKARAQDATKHLDDLNRLYISTIETLAMAIDAKDQLTHGHIRRVQRLAIRLAQEVGVNNAQLLKAIEAAAPLHDMGKLAVPEYILNKPGPLTHSERAKMETHASIGADILSSINFPYPVVPVVRHHHENWDGTGYPDGLSGTDIPLGARILSVADCYDALTSDRPYRPRLTSRVAIDTIYARRGHMYDPLVVDALVRLMVTTGTTNARDEVATIENGPGAFVLTRTLPAITSIAASRTENSMIDAFAVAIKDADTITAVGQVCVHHLQQLIVFSDLAIFISNDANELVVGYASGPQASLLLGLRVDLGTHIAGWVAANDQTIVNANPELDLGIVAVTRGLRSTLSTPIDITAGCFGVIALYSPQEDGFDHDHARFLEAISSRMGSRLRQLTGAVGTKLPSTPFSPFSFVLITGTSIEALVPVLLAELPVQTISVSAVEALYLVAADRLTVMSVLEPILNSANRDAGSVFVSAAVDITSMDAVLKNLRAGLRTSSSVRRNPPRLH